MVAFTLTSRLGLLGFPALTRLQLKSCGDNTQEEKERVLAALATG